VEKVETWPRTKKSSKSSDHKGVKKMLISILSAEVAVCLIAGILFGVKDVPFNTVAMFALIFFFASLVLIDSMIGINDFQFLLFASGLGAEYFVLGWLWTEDNHR